MVTRTAYNEIAVKAAFSVLIEIVRILGEYRDDMVLIGGWVPQLLFQSTGEWHTGSIDVDLAFDHRRITGEVYKGIHDLLLERGYKQGKQPFTGSDYKHLRASGLSLYGAHPDPYFPGSCRNHQSWWPFARHQN